MRDPAAGLHEKMTWFWHGHLTSAYDKVGSWRMNWNQHGLVRQHALGNYRTMLTAMTSFLGNNPSDGLPLNPTTVAGIV